MSIVLDGTAGITTPGLTNTGSTTIVALTTTGNTILGDASTDTLNVGNGNLVTDASGNVGIGNTSPAARIDVFRSTVGTYFLGGGGDNVARQLAIKSSTTTNSGDTHTFDAQSGTGILAFAITGTERARIDSSGNLGLGVTPSAWGSTFRAMDVLGYASFSGYNNNEADMSCNGYYNSGWKYKNTAAATLYQQNAGTHAWHTAASGTAGNAISFTQAMTLDASGNLLVGTTSTGFTSSGSTYYSPPGQYWINNHLTGTSSGTRYIGFGIGTAEVGSITQSGTTAVLYNTTSDYRLKNNQQALTGAKDFIMALRPKKWQWWDGSGEGVGFVAHEFMEVAKYSGNGEKDAIDADGKPVYQSIQPSSSEVMANLVAFIQEQQALIQTLTDRITALESA